MNKSAFSFSFCEEPNQISDLVDLLEITVKNNIESLLFSCRLLSSTRWLFKYRFFFHSLPSSFSSVLCVLMNESLARCSVHRVYVWMCMCDECLCFYRKKKGADIFSIYAPAPITIWFIAYWIQRYIPCRINYFEIGSMETRNWSFTTVRIVSETAQIKWHIVYCLHPESIWNDSNDGSGQSQWG